MSNREITESNVLRSVIAYMRLGQCDRKRETSCVCPQFKGSCRGPAKEQFLFVISEVLKHRDFV